MCACICTLTSADFSTHVFTLAVVTLTVFAVDAGVPRWMAGTLSTQALTYKKNTDCPHGAKFHEYLLFPYVWNGWFSTQIDLPEKMSPGIVENLYLNLSIVKILTQLHVHKHLEKLSFYFSQSEHFNHATCNTCNMIFYTSWNVCAQL